MEPQTAATDDKNSPTPARRSLAVYVASSLLLAAMVYVGSYLALRVSYIIMHYSSAKYVHRVEFIYPIPVFQIDKPQSANSDTSSAVAPPSASEQKANAPGPKHEILYKMATCFYYPLIQSELLYWNLREYLAERLTSLVQKYLH
ncbi:MAG: hypothetical protein ACAI35_19990 [Candidatus Methylacidiphilales bacterium]|nr:hypothetical protein [Candidatus Methylacidiphilales bacterium]